MFERLPLIWTSRGITSREAHPFARLDDAELDNRCLIETTRTQDGVPWLWPRHLVRAETSLQQLEVELPSQPMYLPTAEELTPFVRQIDAGDIVVRLNLLLDDSFEVVGDIWVDARRLPPFRESLRLKTMTRKRNAILFGAAFKGFGRGILADHRDSAQQLGADDALLLDSAGQITESTWANIFLKFDDTWTTPPANGDILPGIARGLILDRSMLAQVREASISASALPRCRAAFACNSVRGIIPITQIDSVPIPIDPAIEVLRTQIFAV